MEIEWVLCKSNIHLPIEMQKRPQKLLAAALLLAASAQAYSSVLPVIDINNPPGNPAVRVGLPFTHYQQSYAASHAGLLSGFGLYGSAADSMNSTYYAVVSIKVGGSQGWQTGGWMATFDYRLDGKLADLSTFKLQVNEGDSIFFDVGPYPGLPGGSVPITQVSLGKLYSKHNNEMFPFLHENRSLAFTTWMVPSPIVPDEPPPHSVAAPGAGALMLLGLAVLGLARNYSRQRALAM